MTTSLDNNDRQRFNHWSETYEQSLLQWLIFDRVHRGILAHLPAGGTPCCILDIGCGTGRLLRRLHALLPAAILVGVDPSEGMVSKARQLAPYASIFLANAEQLPFEGNSFDLVTSSMSLHHWSNQAQGLGEISRLLHYGGVFVLADTNVGHGHPLSRAEVRALSRAAGLSIQSQSSPIPLISITVDEKS